ncbi:unnamed protein product, partial [Prorocentrum cordatum]
PRQPAARSRPGLERARHAAPFPVSSAEAAGMSADGARARGGAGGGSAGETRKALSVIVPTYNEVENIRPLCERLFKAVKDAGLTTELVVVDDESAGSDETARIVRELGEQGFPVRIHCRKRVEGRGLSSAVLLGFQMAKHDVVLCMDLDADLQHEPESVPAVAEPVLSGSAEFSIGSRHVAGGGLGFEWSKFRTTGLVSWGATLLAWPVAASTDPMSGFFCTSKPVLGRAEGRLNLIGFKIGLEIMARCRCHPVKDVAITFQERNAGESKLSAKQYQLYLQQLAGLYVDRLGMPVIVCLVFLALVI